MTFERLAVVGVGLIGGSFALATKSRGLVRSAIGVARSPTTRQAAIACGVVDEVTADPAVAVSGADLVYLAAPVGATGPLMQALAPAVSTHALVTDAGSTKASVMALAARHLRGRCSFVGGHPMAGSEESGPAAARPDLFVGRTYFLTRGEDTPEASVERLVELVAAIGARPVLVDAHEHDRYVAATSHLPHLVSAALAGTLAKIAADTCDLSPFIGSGFLDVTRLAKGETTMWRDILLDNCEAVRQALRQLEQELDAYAAAIQAGDGAALDGLLTRARVFRRSLDPS